MKTGTFIERGYDDDRGQNFYKLYFDKENNDARYSLILYRMIQQHTLQVKL